MVFGTKTGRGSSIELKFSKARTDELLELLEEEVLEDIMNRVKTIKISKKSKKIRVGRLRKTEQAECNKRKMEEEQQKKKRRGEFWN